MANNDMTPSDVAQLQAELASLRAQLAKVTGDGGSSASAASAPSSAVVLSKLDSLVQSRGNADTVLRLIFAILKGASAGLLANQLGAEHPLTLAAGQWASVIDNARGALDLVSCPWAGTVHSLLNVDPNTAKDPVVFGLAILNKITVLWYSYNVLGMWLGSWAPEWAKSMQIEVKRWGFHVCSCWLAMVLLGLVSDGYQAQKMMKGGRKVDLERQRKAVRALVLRTIKNLVDATLALNALGVNIYGLAMGGWMHAIPSAIGVYQAWTE